MAKYLSTKTYGNDRGLSCCFRQWRSTHSHCSLLHGYSIGIKLIFEKLKEDKRVDYLIFNGKIWSKARAKEGNRKYSGSNQHTKHLHISIKEDMATDTSPWFWWLNQPKIITQIGAKIIPIPAKKAYKAEVCTCCKVHGKK